jgi:hypothetical protein
VAPTRISDEFARLAFYRSWLNLESPLVGETSANLVQRTDRTWKASANTPGAWPPPKDDLDFQVSEWQAYQFDTEEEQEVCPRVMRREFRLLAPICRRSSRSDLAAQQAGSNIWLSTASARMTPGVARAWWWHRLWVS